MKRLFLALTLLTFGTAALPAELADWLTFKCLGAYDGDINVEACSQLYPGLKGEIQTARAKWEVRNSAAIKELREACDARLREAYGGDAAKVGKARAEAREFQSQMDKALVSDPRAESTINCRAYIDDMSAGTGHVDDLRAIIKMTRRSGAKPWAK